MKINMCYDMRQFIRIVFFMLFFVMCRQIPVSALHAETHSVNVQAYTAAVTKSDMPPLVLVEGSGSSFLSRVFSSLLLSSEQEAVQSPDTTLSPTVSLENLRAEIPSKLSSSVSALRSPLFIGSLGISWGLIVLLTFRLAILKKMNSQQPFETDMITSTGYQILGNIAGENHKFQLAAQCYRKIAEKESYNKEVHHDIGKALFHAERYTEAIKEFHIALGSEIISPEIYGLLAKAYEAVKQSERAAHYFQKAQQFTISTPVRQKESRNVIPLQRRLKISKIPRQAQKISA